MRKIYIDVGAHNGSFIDKFFKEVKDDDYLVLAFEPNPKFFDALKSKPICFFPLAVWIENSKKDFFIDSGKKAEGSTLDSSKLTNISLDLSIQVPTIDFSEFLNNFYNEEDFIVVKMDIEGSEYDVVPKMIETGAADKISVFILDLHHNRISKNVSKELEKIRLYFMSRGKSFVLHSNINYADCISNCI